MPILLLGFSGVDAVLVVLVAQGRVNAKVLTLALTSWWLVAQGR